MSFQDAIDELQDQLWRLGIKSIYGKAAVCSRAACVKLSYNGAVQDKDSGDFCVVVRMEYAHDWQGVTASLIEKARDTAAIIAAVKAVSAFKLTQVKTGDNLAGDFVTQFEALCTLDTEEY